MTTQLIGLDWGSTHLRAYRFGERGLVEEVRTLSCGIRELPAGGFAEAFMQAVREWPQVPVLACGMVGSRNGWLEVPYLDTPTRTDRLAAALKPFTAPDGRTVHLVPGLRDPGRPDVMRGEETQVAGVLAQFPAASHRGQLLLPGTHSKWVTVRDGAITGFATVMTGELYGLLSRHSILGASLPPAVDDDAAFRRGAATARDSGAAGVLSRVFSARTLMLDGTLAPASVADYLSGLLIGDELRVALAAGWIDAREPLLMVGDAALCSRYLKAAEAYGLQLTRAPDATTARGLWLIAVEAGLVTTRATA
ncbi:2-keto-3-deoxy-galactonokinase [Rhodanobacter denitrificans]|uniref:2-keto-3-deoxy-galactonokinase n=1 Tax=Rhodanobacter denitrificans TaxID=666685 RepID=A0A368KC89_9GAMM|nr:2-dehydro-3-deoxygalactonokinase [Rhodanobacter denitrificans]RCS28615.1 2-keto-3-deoxy-galactonokinase [Rhodanobacter denitrificans]